MIYLRNTLAIALTTAALGLGALSMSTPAEAHGIHEMGHGREMGFNWDRGFGHHNHCDVWGASCNRGGGGHRWGYGWGHGYGYGYAYGYSPVVVEVAPICPPGTHPSYSHDLCVPNYR